MTFAGTPGAGRDGCGWPPSGFWGGWFCCPPGTVMTCAAHGVTKRKPPPSVPTVIAKPVSMWPMRGLFMVLVPGQRGTINSVNFGWWPSGTVGTLSASSSSKGLAARKAGSHSRRCDVVLITVFVNLSGAWPPHNGGLHRSHVRAVHRAVPGSHALHETSGLISAPPCMRLQRHCYRIDPRARRPN